MKILALLGVAFLGLILAELLIRLGVEISTARFCAGVLVGNIHAAIMAGGR